MRTILWTKQARSDLSAIHAFITQDSPHFASVVVAQLIGAAAQLAAFPQSGRTVSEFDDPLVRELVRQPYRIVYRLVGHDQVHILTVHHGAQRFPADI